MFVICAFLLPAGCSTLQPAHALKSDAVDSDHQPADLDEARLRWFMQQREYPFGSVPADARRQAFEQATRESRVRADAVAAPLLSGSWVSVGPSPASVNWSAWKSENGRINAVAVSPVNPSLVLVAGANGGIWRSTNGGASFSAVSDSQVDLALGSISFAPSNPNIVYAGMGNIYYLGTGVLRSTDAGQTWSRVDVSGFGTRTQTTKMLVDPNDANKLFAAQWATQDASGNSFASGLLASTDGGANWTTILGGWIDDIVQVPGNSSVLVAAAQGIYSLTSTGPGIYRSPDGGATWSRITTPLDSNAGQFSVHGHLAVTAAAPNNVYYFAEGPIGGVDGYHLFVSTDGGSTWAEQASATLPQERADVLAVSPGDPLTMYLCVRDLYKSSDGGATWTDLTNGYSGSTFHPSISKTHVDQRSFGFTYPAAGGAITAAQTSNDFFVGNDGSLYHSTDGGSTLSDMAPNIGSLIQYYSIAAKPGDATVLVGGAQDNGLLKRSGTSSTWSEQLTGDHGSFAFNVSTPSSFLNNTTYGNIDRYINDGTFSANVASNATFGEASSTTNIAFIAPMTTGPTGIVYFGTYKLFSSSDFGTSWQAISPRLTGTTSQPTITSIAVAPGSATVVYVGSSDGRVHETGDGGTTWNDVTGTIPNRTVTSILPVGVGATAFLSVSGFGSAHVFKTTNYGSTWTASSSGLPDIPVNALFLDTTSGAMFAGTDIGVFQSTDSGATWSLFNSGMPPVVVMGFTRAADGKIYAATYGRGAYVLATTSSVHGDANGDGVVSVPDIFYLVNSIFASGPAPLGPCDVNADGFVNAADVIYLANYLFAGGQAPK